MRMVASQNPHSPQASVAGGESRLGRSAPASTADSRRTTDKKRGKAFSELDLSAFFSNTATLLGSGVPLIKSLEALMTDEAFKHAVPTLETLTHDIRSGSSLSNALSKHPKSFSPMIVSLVRAAEASSTLVTALERIAEDIEERRDSRTQLRKALTYPTIVTVLGSGAVGFLMVFVVPVFQETYDKAGMPLPTITVVLIALSEFVGKTWWIVIGLSVLGTLLYRRFRNDERVQVIRDRMLLRLPVLGPVIRTVLIGQFIQAFGSLLDAGVSIKESLALTENVVQHSEFRKMARELQFAIARGEGIGRKLGEFHSIFPPLLTQMITLGEKSGELGKMVVQIGVYVRKDLKRRTQQMSMLIEPIVTVGMAVAIGAVALAIYLPIFDMFKQVDN